MYPIKELVISVQSYFKVLPFVLRNNIWSFFLLPLTLNLGLIASLLYLVFESSAFAEEELVFLMMEWGLVDLVWISLIVKFLLSYGLKMILFYFVWQFYQLLSLIFLSPLFSYLSEKVQESLTGVEVQFSGIQFLKDVLRGIKIGMKNITLQLIWIMVFYSSVFVFPFLSVFLPFVLFMLGAYYYGFAMIDYRSEVFHLDAENSRRFVKKHRYLALGNGIVFQVLLLVPVLGTLFAPSFALVAAALGIEEIYGEAPRLEK